MNTATRARDLRGEGRVRGRPISALALGVSIGVLFATPVGWAGSPRGSGGDRVMAEVDGEVITTDAVDQALGHRLDAVKQQLYQLRRLELEELIAQKLVEREAARRGISVQRLLDMEVKTKVRATDQEVEAFYREHKDSVPAPQAAAKEAFRRYLEQRKQAELATRLVENLKSRARVRVYMVAPAPIPADLTLPGAAFKGPKDAWITIVEFADFQCPFCAEAEPVLQQVLQIYSKEVKLVYRHFPLASHPQAKVAAEAAECAAQQGKFWEYHAQLWANASQLSPGRLRALAEELRLDVQAFGTCLDTGKTRARIQQDLADGGEAGVTGTPTFFINGRILEGAQPFATFKRMIDQELAVRGPSRGATRR